MADIVTGTVSGQVDMSNVLKEISDSRREQEVIGAQIRHETAIDNGRAVDAVKTAAWNNSDRTGAEADRVVAQSTAYFIAQQQNDFSAAAALAALKSSTDAGVNATLAAISLAAERSTAAAALEAAKTASTLAIGHAVIGQQIIADGQMTRALINDRQVESLNRELIERNALLVAERDRCGYWQGQFGNSQFSQLSNQVNALNSQMTETRQGMVNFGTMAGVGQSSTSNNVR